MDPLTLLKQLKNIEPDAEYRRRSRAQILASTRASQSLPLNILDFLVRGLEIGSAIAVTSFILILILGGFGGRGAPPHGFSPLNLDSLKAEAEAIDIQIELTNLQYLEGTLGAPLLKKVQEAAETLVPQTPAGEEKRVDDAPDSQEPVTIEEALKRLSQD